MKIAVYGICLNEAANVERFVASAREADLIQIADTGSTDDTVARLQALGVSVRPIRISPWRFDVARNAALVLLPRDIDVCVSLDLDQTLQPGWRQALERGWTDGANIGVYTEIWDRTEDGAPRRILNNRVHARRGFRWTAPCHEYLVADGVPMRPVHLPGFVVEQAQDAAKDRSDYMPLLELAIAEQPDEPRHLHYLGREYVQQKRYAEAIGPLERHVAAVAEPGNPERNKSLRLIGWSRLELGEADAALALFRQAAGECPASRGALTDLASVLYHRRGDSGEAYDRAVQAAALPDVTPVYGQDPELGGVPEDLAALAAWRLGRLGEALQWARKAAAACPGSERIAENLKRLEAGLAAAG